MRKEKSEAAKVDRNRLLRLTGSAQAAQTFKIPYFV